MTLEEVKAKIKKLEDDDKALREERDAAELEKLVDEHPEYFSPANFVVVECPLVKHTLPGHVVMRMPTLPEQQQLRETLLDKGAEAKGKAFGQIARRCRVYPDEPVYLDMLKAYPGISDQSASAVMVASDGKEREAKKG